MPNRWRRITTGIIIIAALFAAATLVPAQIYQPSCGRFPKWGLGGSPKISGPLREEYVEMLTRAMDEDGFRYWRFGNAILIPFWPVFEGNRRWDWTYFIANAEWFGFVANAEWRIAHSIANGYTAHGCARPPEALRRLIGEYKPTCGVPPERLPGGRVVYPGGVAVAHDCALFRAAVIRIEDMPQPLPELEHAAIPSGIIGGPPKHDPELQPP
jgi:hypothetical protein